MITAATILTPTTESKILTMTKTTIIPITALIINTAVRKTRLY